MLIKAAAPLKARRPNTSAKSWLFLPMPLSYSFFNVPASPSTAMVSWLISSPYFASAFAPFALSVESPIKICFKAVPASAPLIPTFASVPSAALVSWMPTPQFLASGAAFFTASASSSTLVALCAAVLESMSFTLPNSSTLMPKPFMVLVAMSAASAKLMALACASCSVLDKAAVACVGVKPLRVRFSKALAASLAVYFVVPPSRLASASIALKSSVLAFVTARTLAIPASKSFPALIMLRPNSVIPKPMPSPPNVLVMVLRSFLKYPSTSVTPCLMPCVSRFSAIEKLSFAILNYTLVLNNAAAIFFSMSVMVSLSSGASHANGRNSLALCTLFLSKYGDSCR